jgi:hypothetical protein
LGYTRNLADDTISLWIKMQALAVVAAVELGLGITAASLVTLSPLAIKIIQFFRRNKPSDGHAPLANLSSNLLNMNSADIGGTTLNTDKEKNSNDVNFLLSATRPGQRRIYNSDLEQSTTQDMESFTLPPIGRTEPLKSVYISTEGMNAVPSPQPNHNLSHRPLQPSQRGLDEPGQEISKSQQVTQSQGGWWQNRVRSVRNSISSFTTHQSNTAARQESLNVEDTFVPPVPTIEDHHMPESIERQPLEAGFRRWVIDKSQRPGGNRPGGWGGPGGWPRNSMAGHG